MGRGRRPTPPWQLAFKRGRWHDVTRGDKFGSSFFEVNQSGGLRWSAAKGFLRPALRRPNLTLLTGAHVERLVIEGGRATGVRFIRDGRRVLATARGGIGW